MRFNELYPIINFYGIFSWLISHFMQTQAVGQKSLFVGRLFTNEVWMKIRPPTEKNHLLVFDVKAKMCSFSTELKALEMCWKSAAGTKVVWSCWRQFLFLVILHEISLSEVNYARTWTWFSFKSSFCRSRVCSRKFICCNVKLKSRDRNKLQVTHQTLISIEKEKNQKLELYFRGQEKSHCR